MPFIAWDRRDSALASLGLPAELESLSEGRLPDLLGDTFSDPLHRFHPGELLPGGWDAPDATLIPFLEDTVSTLAVRIRQGTEDYLRVFHEIAGEFVVATSLLGLKAHILGSVVESMGGASWLRQEAQKTDLDSLSRLAQDLHFDVLERLLDLYEQNEGRLNGRETIEDEIRRW